VIEAGAKPRALAPVRLTDRRAGSMSRRRHHVHCHEEKFRRFPLNHGSSFPETSQAVQR